MKCSLRWATLLLAFGFSLPALADDANPAAGQPVIPGLAGGAQGAGGLSPAEFRAKLIQKYDTNGDGQLTGDEMILAQEEIAKNFGNGPAGAIFDDFKKQFDLDGDGKLSAQESMAAQRAWQRSRSNGVARRGVQTGVMPGGAGGGGGGAGGLGGGGGFGDDEPAKRRDVKKRFDKDGDGKVSASEKAEAQKARLDRMGSKGKAAPAAGKLSEAMKKFDADGDGKLDDDEKAAMREAAKEKKAAKKKPE